MPRRAASSSPAGRSSRAPRATPGSAWRWSPTRSATRRSSSCPRTSAARRWTRCARSAPSWCWCPPHQVLQPRPFRPHLAPAGRGDRRRGLGQPVRQHRQPPAPTSKAPRPRSGSRWTGGSTASPARSAPAARSPGSGMGLKELDENVTIALTDPHGAALYNYYAHGELQGRGQLGRRRDRAGADHRQPRRRADRHPVPRLGRGRAANGSPGCCSEEGLCLGLSSGINVAGAVALGQAAAAQAATRGSRRSCATPASAICPRSTTASGWGPRACRFSTGWHDRLNAACQMAVANAQSPAMTRRSPRPSTMHPPTARERAARRRCTGCRSGCSGWRRCC